MNTSNLSKHYDHLTPEERFRLILAAGVRGDKVEQQRLSNAGKWLMSSAPDHTPYAQAFDEIALLIFIELLEEAVRYTDLLDRSDEANDTFSDETDEEGNEEDETDEGEGNEEAEEEEDSGSANAEDEDQEDYRTKPVWQRMLDLALAAGFMLKTKAGGWQLFCERKNLPPFALWEDLPGFDRLQRTLKMTEKAAFAPAGFLRWMNDHRPEGHPELTEIPITVERFADSIERLFQNRALWFGG